MIRSLFSRRGLRYAPSAELLTNTRIVTPKQTRVCIHAFLHIHCEDKIWSLNLNMNFPDRPPLCRHVQSLVVRIFSSPLTQADSALCSLLSVQRGPAIIKPEPCMCVCVCEWVMGTMSFYLCSHAEWWINTPLITDQWFQYKDRQLFVWLNGEEITSDHGFTTYLLFVLL